MIAVSPEAAQHLIGMRASRGVDPSAGARFVPMSDGVGLSIVGGPKPGDKAVTARGVQIFLSPDVARRLKGSTLDVTERTGTPAFVIRTPNPARIARPRV